MAAAVRLCAWHFQPFVTYDGTAYIGLADGFLSGRLDPSVYSPGYPALIALILPAMRDPVFAAAIISFVSGVLLPVVTWVLAKQAVGERWALVPLLAVAVHPELARFSVMSMSESLFLVLVYGACSLLGRGLWSGALAGAAYAVRPEGMVIAGLLWLERGLSVVRRQVSGSVLLLFSAGLLAVSIPCVAYFHQSLGVWTLTPKVEALRAPTLDWRKDEPRRAGATMEPLSQRLDLPRRLARNGPDLLRAWPGNAMRVAREVVHLWPIPLLVLSVLGLVLRRGPESSIFIYLLVLPLLGLSYQPRFALVFVPALALAATVPVARATSELVRRGAITLWVVGVIACLVSTAEDFMSPFDGEIGSAQRAGRWLSTVMPPGTVVLDRKPFLAFYARCKFQILPDDPYEDVIAEAVRSGVGALVIEEQLVRTMRPQFAPLVLDPDVMAREKRLELVYIGGEQPNYGLVIFRVLRPGEIMLGRQPVVDIVRHR